MSEKTLTAESLENFAGGSDTIFQHSLVRSIRYTPGVQHVAFAGGAYWLIDEIALAQRDAERPEIRAQEFQVWILTVEGHRSVLRVEDGDYNVVWKKEIDFTDFPLPEIKLWFTDSTILLPNEY